MKYTLSTKGKIIALILAFFTIIVEALIVLLLYDIRDESVYLLIFMAILGLALLIFMIWYFRKMVFTIDLLDSFLELHGFMKTRVMFKDIKEMKYFTRNVTTNVDCVVGGWSTLLRIKAVNKAYHILFFNYFKNYKSMLKKLGKVKKIKQFA